MTYRVLPVLVAATCVALTACTHEAGTTSSAESHSASAAMETPTSYIADMLQHVPMNQPPTPIGVENEWFSIDGTALFPGSSIGAKKGDEYFACTTSFLATDQDGNPVAVTAGHCIESEGDDVFRKDPATGGLITFGTAVYRIDTNTLIGDWGDSYSDSAEDEEKAAELRQRDEAIIAIDNDVSNDYKIAGVYDIVGVARTSDLTPGMQLCKFGRRTQETCGPLLDTPYHKNLEIDLRSIPGDSGSPVYAKVGGNQVVLVGIVSGIGSTYTQDQQIVFDTTEAVSVWDVLERHHLKLNGQAGYLNY